MPVQSPGIQLGWERGSRWGRSYPPGHGSYPNLGHILTCKASFQRYPEISPRAGFWDHLKAVWAGRPLSSSPVPCYVIAPIMSHQPGLANHSSPPFPYHRSSFLVCKVAPWILPEGCPGSSRMGFPPRWPCGTLDILRLREERRAVVWFLERGPKGLGDEPCRHSR